MTYFKLLLFLILLPFLMLIGGLCASSQGKKKKKEFKPFDVDCNKYTWGKKHHFCRKTFFVKRNRDGYLM